MALSPVAEEAEYELEMMPLAPAPAVPAPAVPTPVPAPAVPDAEVFYDFEQQIGVYVKQKVHLLGDMSGYEQSVEYLIYSLNDDWEKGEEIFSAKERLQCCCEPQFCGSARGFTFDVSTTAEPKKQVLTMQRLDASLDCCCACRSLCLVKDSIGHIIGEVYHPYTCCETVLLVRGPGRGHLWYSIKSGSHCNQVGFCCKCPCKACMVIHFSIVDPEGKEVGSLTRQNPGCVAAASKADDFTLDFPRESNYAQRATLIAAILLVDFIHFTKSD